MSSLSSSLISSHPTRPSLASKTLTLNSFLISIPVSKRVRPRYLLAPPLRRARTVLTVDSSAADRSGVQGEASEVLLEGKDPTVVISESRQEILRGVNLTVREGEVAVEQPLKDENVQIPEVVDALKSGPSILKVNVNKITDSAISHRPKTLKKERNPKKIRSSPRIVLDCYQILKYALFTESAMKNMSDNNTLVFIVDTRADKNNIREAVEKMCNVQIKKINTLINPDGAKKAFVGLAQKYNAVDVARKMYNI